MRENATAPKLAAYTLAAPPVYAGLAAAARKMDPERGFGIRKNLRAALPHTELKWSATSAGDRLYFTEVVFSGCSKWSHEQH